MAERANRMVLVAGQKTDTTFEPVHLYHKGDELDADVALGRARKGDYVTIWLCVETGPEFLAVGDFRMQPLPVAALEVIVGRAPAPPVRAEKLVGVLPVPDGEPDDDVPSDVGPEGMAPEAPVLVETVEIARCALPGSRCSLADLHADARVRGGTIFVRAKSTAGRLARAA